MKVRVSPNAAQSYSAIDEALKEEVRHAVSEVADRPADLLVRTEIAGIHQYSIRCGSLEGCEIVLLFKGWDQFPQRLELISISFVYS